MSYKKIKEMENILAIKQTKVPHLIKNGFIEELDTLYEDIEKDRITIYNLRLKLHK